MVNSDRARDLCRQFPCFATWVSEGEIRDPLGPGLYSHSPPSDLFLEVSMGRGVKKAFPDHKFIITLIRIILKSYFPPSAVFKQSANFCHPDVRLCCREGKNCVI